MSLVDDFPLDRLRNHSHRSYGMPSESVYTHAGVDICYQWALIELARNPDKQDKLREELLAFGGDPSWDDLTSAEKLPYLDWVVHEILRIHSSAPEVMRIVRISFSYYVDVYPETNAF
jgi:hypothetical protein